MLIKCSNYIWEAVSPFVIWRKKRKEQARKPPSYASSKLWITVLTGVKCRATNVAKKFALTLFNSKLDFPTNQIRNPDIRLKFSLR